MVSWLYNEGEKNLSLLAQHPPLVFGINPFFIDHVGLVINRVRKMMHYSGLLAWILASEVQTIQTNASLTFIF
ncbi:hypothetical protein C5976_18765 [Cronobacter sakazakii]|nr:hypothetical protein C5976_18765 [Cronobacter sakazakii]